jgi:hypothetical protein
MFGRTINFNIPQAPNWLSLQTFNKMHAKIENQYVCAKFVASQYKNGTILK